MNFRSSLVALAVAAALAGCSSTPTPQDAPAAPEARSSYTPTEAPPAERYSPSDPRAGFAKRSVYFEFDHYDVKPEYRGLVEAHAKYLKQNPQATLRIEGNADERGSREYNLSLGQRRAESVLKMMKLLGVREGQVEAVSFGEEKPRAHGHDEAAYAENRRSDFGYGK
jgi:peptidoglycan-associated lipoprotein